MTDNIDWASVTKTYNEFMDSNTDLEVSLYSPETGKTLRVDLESDNIDRILSMLSLKNAMVILDSHTKAHIKKESKNLTKEKHIFEIIDQAISDGPLGTSEVDRRARIAFVNLMAVCFREEIDNLKSFPRFEPETRQVVARLVEMLDLVALNSETLLDGIPSHADLMEDYLVSKKQQKAEKKAKKAKKEKKAKKDLGS